MRFLVADSHGKLSRFTASAECNAMIKDAPKPDIVQLSGPDASNTTGTRIQRLCLIDDFEGSRCVAVISGELGDGSASIEILNIETGETSLNLSLGEHKTDHAASADVQGEEEVCVVLEYALGMLCLVSSHGRLWAFDLSQSGEQTVPQFQYSLPGPVGAFCLHPRLPGLFAFGGKENDLQIWKSASEQEGDKDPLWQSMQPCWKAKNVKNDHLDLRVPVWLSGVAFLPSATETAQALKLVTSTMYGQVRIYTTDKARRPVQQIEPGEHAIQSIFCLAEEEEIILRDTHANVLHVSLQNTTAKAKILGAYKGFSSNVSTLSARQGFVVAGALDGYVRVYDLKSHACRATVYLDGNRKVVQVIFLDDNDAQEIKPEEADDEDVWDGIEQVDDGAEQGSRKRVKR